MRKFMGVLSALGAVCGVGCSSVPDFKPSHPIEEAASWREALLSCGEYRISFSSDPALKSMRPAASVVPWVRCSERIFLKKSKSGAGPFPWRRQGDESAEEGFALFYRELSLWLEKYQARSEEVDAREWNAHMPRLLALVASAPGAAPIADAAFEGWVSRTFPQFAAYLAQIGFFSPRQTRRRSARLRPEIREILLQRARGVDEGSIRRQLSYWKTKKKRPECARFLEFQADLLRLEELERYRGELSEGSVLKKVDQSIDALAGKLRPQQQNFELRDCLR